jgi:hypothetical protein
MLWDRGLRGALKNIGRASFIKPSLSIYCQLLAVLRRPVEPMRFRTPLRNHKTNDRRQKVSDARNWKSGEAALSVLACNIIPVINHRCRHPQGKPRLSHEKRGSG